MELLGPTALSILLGRALDDANINATERLMLPRKQSSCSVLLILTFSGYDGQEKTRFLREKKSIILCKYLKILVFLIKGGR